jgi:hypothetical protein
MTAYSLDGVTMKMNTSTEMLKKVYLHSSNKEFSLQRQINKYKEHYIKKAQRKLNNFLIKRPE